MDRNKAIELSKIYSQEVRNVYNSCFVKKFTEHFVRRETNLLEYYTDIAV